jgi:hypothetical protein
MALHAPYYASGISVYAPAATRGNATAENFKAVTFNVGAKTNAMFSGQTKNETFRNKLLTDMMLMFQDVVACTQQKVHSSVFPGQGA